MKKMINVVVLLVVNSSVMCLAKRDVTLTNETKGSIEFVVRSVGCAKIVRGKTLACAKDTLAPATTRTIELSRITSGKVEVIVFTKDQQFTTGWQPLEKLKSLRWPSSFGSSATQWVTKNGLLNSRENQHSNSPASTTQTNESSLSAAPAFVPSGGTVQIAIKNDRLGMRTF